MPRNDNVITHRRYFDIIDVDHVNILFAVHMDNIFKSVSAYKQIRLTPLFKNQWTQCWLEQSRDVDPNRLLIEKTEIAAHTKYYMCHCRTIENDDEFIEPIDFTKAQRTEISQCDYDRFRSMLQNDLDSAQKCKALKDEVIPISDFDISYRICQLADIPGLYVIQGTDRHKYFSAYCDVTFAIERVYDTELPRWLGDEHGERAWPMMFIPEVTLARSLNAFYTKTVYSGSETKLTGMKCSDTEYKIVKINNDGSI